MTFFFKFSLILNYLFISFFLYVLNFSVSQPRRLLSMIFILINYVLFLICVKLEYIAFIILIIYVGAVSVIFLFMIMLINVFQNIVLFRESFFVSNFFFFFSFILFYFLKFFFFTFGEIFLVNLNNIFFISLYNCLIVPVCFNVFFIEANFFKINLLNNLFFLDTYNLKNFCLMSELDQLGYVFWHEYWLLVVLSALILVSGIVGSITILKPVIIFNLITKVNLQEQKEYL